MENSGLENVLWCLALTVWSALDALSTSVPLNY
jgi:hypothetical protein